MLLLDNVGSFAITVITFFMSFSALADLKKAMLSFQAKTEKFASCLPRKTFELFYMFSERKFFFWSIFSCTVISFLLIVNLINFIIFWQTGTGKFTWKNADFRILSYLVTILVMFPFWLAYTCRLSYREIDRVTISLKHLSPKINFLKKYQTYKPAVGDSELFTKSVAFLINSPQLDLNKKNTKRILKQIRQLLIFFSKSINKNLDSKSNNDQLNLLEIVKSFDEFLNDCKFEVKVSRLCLHTISKHCLTRSLWIDDQN